MITTHCPRCSESIRLPSASLPDDAYAECPICRETFPASDVVERLPPVLNLIGADGHPLQIQTGPLTVASLESAASLESVGVEHGAVEHGGIQQEMHELANEISLEPSADLSDDLMDQASELGSEVAPEIEIEAEQDNPFFGVESAGAAAVGMAGAAVAGVAATGASMLGLGGGAEAAEVEDEVEVEEEIDVEIEEEEDVDLHAINDEPESEIEIEEEFEEMESEVQEYVETEFEEIEDAPDDLDDGFIEEDLGEDVVSADIDGEGEVDTSKQTVLLDTWQDSRDVDSELSDIDGAGVDGGLSLNAPNPYTAPTELNVVEDSLDVPEEEPGFNEKTTPQTVRGRRRASQKKGSSIKTMLGVLLGPLIAIPLAGGLLLAIGKAPNLGFYPFDGSFSSANGAQRTAAAPPSDIGNRPSPLAEGESSGLEAPDMGMGMGGSDMGGSDMGMVDPGASFAGGDVDMPEVGGGSALRTPPSLGGLPEPLNANTTGRGGETIPAGEPSGPGFSFPGDSAGPPAGGIADATDPANDRSAEAEMLKAKESDPFAGAISLAPRIPDMPKAGPGRDVDQTEPPGLAEKLMALGTGGSEITEEPLGTAPAVAAPDVPSVETPPALSGEADDLFGGALPAPQKLPPVVQDSPLLVASTATASSAITNLQRKQSADAAGKRDMMMTYIAVAKVAEQESSPDSPSVNGLLRDISTSTVLTVFGGDTAKQWFNVSDKARPTNGIIVIGATDATGGTITLPTGDIVSVVSTTGNSLPPSVRVIALGKIVDSAAMKVNIQNVIPF